MRTPAALALFTLAAVSAADRLITIPTARKLPYGDIRAEALVERATGRTVEGFLGFGIGKSFETELHTQKLPGRNGIVTLDFTYNHVAPIPGFAPGVAAGIQDTLNESREGRRLWGAVTHRQHARTISGDDVYDLTFGVSLGRQIAPFAGVSMPIARTLRVLAEHDGYRFSSGFEARVRPGVALRLVFRDRDTLLGLNLATRF